MCVCVCVCVRACVCVCACFAPRCAGPPARPRGQPRRWTPVRLEGVGWDCHVCAPAVCTFSHLPPPCLRLRDALLRFDELGVDAARAPLDQPPRLHWLGVEGASWLPSVHESRELEGVSTASLQSAWRIASHVQHLGPMPPAAGPEGHQLIRRAAVLRADDTPPQAPRRVRPEDLEQQVLCDPLRVFVAERLTRSASSEYPASYSTLA